MAWKLLIHHLSFIIRKSRGFTLIELMVVLSITAVLGTLGIAGFTTYNQIQVLQSSANDLVTTLNLARSRALSQVKLGSSCNTPSKILEGYSVDIISDKSYTLNSHCSADTSILDTKILTQNVSFTSPNTFPTSFFFPILVGGVQGAGQITLSAYGRDKIITINSLGGVNIQLPALTPKPTRAGTRPTPTPTITPTPTPTF